MLQDPRVRLFLPPDPLRQEKPPLIKGGRVWRWEPYHPRSFGGTHRHHKMPGGYHHRAPTDPTAPEGRQWSLLLQVLDRLVPGQAGRTE